MSNAPRDSRHTAFPVVWWFCWILSGPPSLRIFKILQYLCSWGQGHCRWSVLAKSCVSAWCTLSLISRSLSDSASYWNSCVNTTVTPWERDYSPVCFCIPQSTAHLLAHQQSMDGLMGTWMTALKSGVGLESGARLTRSRPPLQVAALMALDWFLCLGFLLRWL